MLIESPQGNILTDPAGEPIDWLDLSWQECRQRALRKRTRGGRDVRLLLRLGVMLRHGDILRRGQDLIVVEPSHLARLVFDDGLTQRDLAVAGHDGPAAVADGEHRGGMGDGHRHPERGRGRKSIVVLSAREGKARGHWPDGRAGTGSFTAAGGGGKVAEELQITPARRLGTPLGEWS